MPASPTPLISIGMPVYNAGTLLAPAIKSILEQSYPHWELLIIDDGSNDQAIENLRITGILDDTRIKLFNDGKNRGLAARLNECITLAQGTLFARMDQDDIALPQRLEKQLAYLQQHPDVDLLSTRVNTMDSQGKINGSLPHDLTHAALCRKPWRSIYMPHPTWMGKIQWFRTFRYASPAPYFCEDQELLLRAHADSKFACLDEVLLHYRVRDKVNLRKLWGTYFAVYKLQCQYFIKHQAWAVLPATAVFLARNVKVLSIWLKQSRQ